MKLVIEPKQLMCVIYGVLPTHLTFSVQHFRDVKMLLSHFKSIV